MGSAASIEGGYTIEIGGQLSPGVQVERSGMVFCFTIVKDRA